MDEIRRTHTEIMLRKSLVSATEATETCMRTAARIFGWCRPSAKYEAWLGSKVLRRVEASCLHLETAIDVMEWRSGVESPLVRRRQEEVQVSDVACNEETLGLWNLRLETTERVVALLESLFPVDPSPET